MAGCRGVKKKGKGTRKRTFLYFAANGALCHTRSTHAPCPLRSSMKPSTNGNRTRIVLQRRCRRRREEGSFKRAFGCEACERQAGGRDKRKRRASSRKSETEAKRRSGKEK